jgi:hypothetical protein
MLSPSQVKAASFSSDRIKALRTHVADEPGMLSAADVVGLLKLFGFSVDKVTSHDRRSLGWLAPEVGPTSAVQPFRCSCIRT